MRVARYRNRLSKEIVGVPSPESAQGLTGWGFEQPAPLEGAPVHGNVTFKSPLQPKPFHNFMIQNHFDSAITISNSLMLHLVLLQCHLSFNTKPNAD